MPPVGFVVAMHGRLLLRAGPARRRRAREVWLVVSRFGPGGATLAVSFAGTGPRACTPYRMRPRMSLVAQHVAQGGRGIVFRFRPSPLPQLLLTGRWCAATGLVRLSGQAPVLRLVAKGRLAAGVSYRLLAAQQPWIGEWHEAHDGALTLGSRADLHGAKR